MKRFVAILSALVVLSLSVNMAFAPAAEMPQAFHQVYMDAYNQGDIDTILALYADDARVFRPNWALAYRGSEGIRRSIEATLAVADRIMLEAVDSGSEGDFAYGVGTYELVTLDGHLLDRGHYMVILRRSDGEWKVVYDMSHRSAFD